MTQNHQYWGNWLVFILDASCMKASQFQERDVYSPYQRRAATLFLLSEQNDRYPMQNHNEIINTMLC